MERPVGANPAPPALHFWRSARRASAGFLSTIAAAVAPAAIVAAYVHRHSPGEDGTVNMAFWIALVIAFCHAMVLGLPCALVLVQRGAFRAAPMLIAGGLCGLVPSGLVFFPYAAPQDLAAFSMLAVVAFGLGASGGLAFYLAHRLIDPDRAFGTARHRRRNQP